MSTQMSAPLSADIAGQLAGLRDIHLPEAISWWPLAPGWWVLLSLVLIAAAGIALIRRHRRRSLKQAALRELALLEKTYSDDNDVQPLATEVGVLIRRVALSLPGGRQYANVHGRPWGDYLAAMPTGMPEAIARLLAIAPYAEPQAIRSSLVTGPDARDPVSTVDIITEAGTWIRRHA